MRKITATFMAAALLFLIATASGQEDEFEKARRLQDKEWETISKQGRETLLESEQAWDRMLKEQQEAWERMVAEINRIWLDSVTTTQKDWVDYSDEYHTRSHVNFEEGDMVLATMIKESEKRSSEIIKERIARQFAKALSPDNQSGRSILEGQIADSQGQPVTAQTLDRYLEHEVFPRLRQDEQPIVGKDGVPRYKVSVPVKLVPNHTEVRATPYVSQVSEEAKRFGLQPELVMAVIHTESYFDPMAHSHVPAYGLMQLVPKFGAREAFRFVHGQDRLLPADYLYVPENNILLGSGYLHLLFHKYFASETNAQRRLYLSVCGYNWGPGAINRKIVGRYPTTNMSPEQLYQVLRQRTPKETSDYLQRVTSRMDMYRPLFKSH
jgi:membrane-bound lytic murein transglycosylase C